MAKNINFLFFFFIFCSFLSYSQANNLKDFEIEGISIGDSLLKHFSKINIDKEINSEFSFKYKNNRFIGLGVGQTNEFSLFKKLNQFDELGITIKPNDENYLVHGISGEILCYNNINKCMIVKDEIIKDLKNIFEDVQIDSWERKHPVDKTKKSIVYGNDLTTNDLDFAISVSVYDMSDDNFNDSVKLSIKTEELSNFIISEAYE